MKKEHRIALLTTILIAAVAALVAYTAHAPSPLPTTKSGDATSTVLVSLGTTTIVAEVADTAASRTQGLSGRTSLPEGTGMLFVFDASSRHGIWMPDMHFHIDILWLDEEQRVVHIEHDVAPDTYPMTFRPLAPARYVLEVPHGAAAAHGVGVGDTLSFTYTK